MKVINIDKWNRKDHFEYYKQADIPYFNITADLDITTFKNILTKQGLRFFQTFLYLVMSTTNEIEAFKLRIRDYQVVRHNLVHPSFIVLTNNNTISFARAHYSKNYKKFGKNVSQAIEKAKTNPIYSDGNKSDYYIYITDFPWVSFKSISHPTNDNNSIPIIAWGKYYETHNKIKIPFSVQGHHGLMDGYHVGTYFNLLQDKLNNFQLS